MQQQWPTMCFFSISRRSSPFYFPLDKLGELHCNFKYQLHLFETEVRDAQPQSLSSLDVAIVIATDRTFTCVSSTVNPKDSASCSSE